MSAEEDTLLEEFPEEEAAQAGAAAATGTEEAAQGDAEADDPELAKIKDKLKEMEEEAEKLKSLTQKQDEHLGSAAPGVVTIAEREEVDSRSIHVGNCDYQTRPEELQAHFQACGAINRVTIVCDKLTGYPKGYGYVEFAEAESVNLALALNDSLFRGRPLRVMPKRTNVPSFLRGGVRGGRGRGGPPYGGGFRGAPRGGFRGAPRGGFRGAPRGGFRGASAFRARPYYAPY